MRADMSTTRVKPATADAKSSSFGQPGADWYPAVHFCNWIPFRLYLVYGYTNYFANYG